MHVCVRACTWLRVQLRIVLVSCLMCEVAVISLSGVWACEEETTWGSRLMKDLHLTQAQMGLSLLAQITWLHGNTFVDRHDKIRIDLPLVIW